jgi:phosphatidylinositol alpha-mannosyltransferase
VKIGLVCPYDIGSAGGVQQLTVELAGQLRRLGDEVVVVAGGRAGYPGGPGLDDSVVPVGRPIFVRGNESRVPLTLSPLSWGRSRRALSDVDVIHVHEPMMPLIGWIALTIDKPTVATFHAAPPAWVPRAYRMAPFVGPKLAASIVTAVSEAAASALPSKWGEVTIIPNAIDVESYRLDVGRVARRVAFLGRDEPRKGLDVLLKAWPVVREAVPDAQLVVMGASREQPTTGVSYLGRVSGGEKRRQLATSSVFVAPNTGGESFGIVVIEGMAAGCAVVASDIPAFRAVTGNGARVFAAGDADALATAVIELLTDDTAREDLARRGLDQVAQFDWSVVAHQYRDLYRKVAS